MHSYEEDNMSTTVAQMTKEELKEMIEKPSVIDFYGRRKQLRRANAVGPLKM
jgi:hypothetical protein